MDVFRLHHLDIIPLWNDKNYRLVLSKLKKMYFWHESV